MEFIELELEGFGSYGSLTTFPLSNQGLILVSGDNGAGKSFLIEAIEWCLFGRTQRKLLADEYVNRYYRKGCRVQLLINNVSGNTIKITRFRNYTNQGSEVQISFLQDGKWINVSKGSVNSNNKFIVELLGIDFDTFSNSVIITGSKVSQFISGTDSERKNVLGQLLRFNEIDKVQNIRKEYKAAADYEYSILNSKIEILGKFGSIISDTEKARCIEELRELKQELERLDYEIVMLEDSSSFLNNWISSRQIDLKIERVDKAKKRLSKRSMQLTYIRNNNTFQIKEYINDVDEKQFEIKQLSKELNDATNILSNWKYLKRRLKRYLREKRQVTKSIKTLNKGLESLTNLHTTYVEKAKHLNEQISKLENMMVKETKCPFCGQDITPEQLVSHINELIKHYTCVNKKALTYSQKKKMLANKISEAETTLQTLQNIINNISDYKKSNIDNAEKSVLILKNKIQSIKNEIDALRNKISELKKGIIELDNKKDHFAKAEAKLDRMKEALLEELSSYKDLNAEIVETQARLKDLYAKFSSMKEKKCRKEKDLATAIYNTRLYNKYLNMRDKVLARIRYLNVLNDVLGWNGIKVVRMNTVVSMLETSINKYLRILSDELMFYSLTYDEDYNTHKQFINRGNRLGKCSFNMLSNGEKKRVMTAAAFALGELVGLTNNCNILCLDEADSGLDAFGQQALFEALQELKKYKTDIFVITHLPSLQSAVFDKRVVVRKVNGISELEGV